MEAARRRARGGGGGGEDGPRPTEAVWLKAVWLRRSLKHTNHNMELKCCKGCELSFGENINTNAFKGKNCLHVPK